MAMNTKMTKARELATEARLRQCEVQGQAGSSGVGQEAGLGHQTSGQGGWVVLLTYMHVSSANRGRLLTTNNWLATASVMKANILLGGASA